MDTATTTRKLPPVPREHWFFKSAWYLLHDTMPYLFQNQAEQPGIYRVTSLFKKVMVVDKPEYVKHVLQDNNKNYVKSFGYEVLARLLGQGLLTSEGDFWRKQRRLAQPAFHRDRLNQMVLTMSNCTTELVEELHALPNKQVNLSKYMMSITLNIVAKSMFGSDVKDMVATVGHEIDYSNEQAIKRIQNPFKPAPWIPTPTNFKEQKSIDTLNSIILGIIENRRKSEGKYDDLLQMLMDAEDLDTGERMSNQQLKDECMTIFLAGHETTALALSWLWYLLDNNPDKKELLWQEVDTVLNGRTPTMEDLPNLPYTRMVLDETLRLYPPAWVIGRRALDDDEIGGYTVPAGYNVLMPVYAMHRNPATWDNPDAFEPERFSKEHIKEKHKYAYYPFGGGPRFCIGNNFALMEMQIIVVMLAQQFDFKLAPGVTIDIDPLVTLRPKGGMPMTVTPRG